MANLSLGEPVSLMPARAAHFFSHAIFSNSPGSHSTPNRHASCLAPCTFVPISHHHTTPPSSFSCVGLTDGMNFQGQRHSKLVQRNISSSTEADRAFAKVTVNNEGETTFAENVILIVALSTPTIFVCVLLFVSPIFNCNAHVDTRSFF